MKKSASFAKTKMEEQTMTKEEIIAAIAELFEKNVIILKIMSSNLEDIERSTSLDNLIILKTEIKRFQILFKELVKKCSSENDENIVVASFITMMYGYYPISYPIDVQKEAMKKTGTEINLSLKDIISKSLKLLLK